VVAAVAAALAIQQRIAATTFAGLALRIRIGVHYGDVLLRDGSAFGDAINIAARLQTLAKPGAICMSDGVYRQVRNKFDEKFTDLGFQKLKNISSRAYRSSRAAHPVRCRGVTGGDGPSPGRWRCRAAGVFAWRQQQSAAPPRRRRRAG
jgi:adenylate cyclase